MLLPVLVPMLLLAGCTKVDQSKAIVLSAIERTEQLARQFTYTDSAGGHTTVVKGDVQDDFRYSLAATVDGRAAASEVVDDDARAMQVTDKSLLPKLASAAASAPVTVVSGQVTSTPAAVPAALSSGQWVVDQAGAVGLAATSSLDQPVGTNPLFDALTALEYVKTAVSAGADVTKFNPESETYRPKLDPFPHPSGDTLRYDVVPPILQPKSTGAGGQLQLSLPDNTFFRLMAIYVRDGMVVDVREKIDIVTRLEDVQSNLEARIGDFVNVPSSATLQQQAGALLYTLNRQLPRIGRPPIRLRDMELDFTSLGSAQPVSLPQNATTGSLAAVDAHGQLLYEQH